MKSQATDSLPFFAYSAAMFVGVFVGTYSSIYIGTAFALWRGLNRQDFIVQVKPEFEDDMFYVPSKDLFLAPTAEVPVTNLLANEILEPDILTALSKSKISKSTPKSQ